MAPDGRVPARRTDSGEGSRSRRTSLWRLLWEEERTLGSTAQSAGVAAHRDENLDLGRRRCPRRSRWAASPLPTRSSWSDRSRVPSTSSAARSRVRPTSRTGGSGSGLVRVTGARNAGNRPPAAGPRCAQRLAWSTVTRCVSRLLAWLGRRAARGDERRVAHECRPDRVVVVVKVCCVQVVNAHSNVPAPCSWESAHRDRVRDPVRGSDDVFEVVVSVPVQHRYRPARHRLTADAQIELFRCYELFACPESGHARSRDGLCGARLQGGRWTCEHECHALRGDRVNAARPAPDGDQSGRPGRPGRSGLSSRSSRARLSGRPAGPVLPVFWSVSLASCLSHLRAL